MDFAAVRKLAARLEQIVGMAQGDRRRSAKIAALLVASGGLIGLWAYLRRQRDRRQPWSALQIFGVGDAIRSLALATVSPHFRNSVLASAGLAAIARYVGPRVIWLPRWIRKGSYSAVLFFFVVIMTIYYFTNVIEKPRYYFNRRSEFLTTIMERLGTPEFRPVFYAFNTHLQTVLCNSLNKLDEMFASYAKVRRETIEAWDGNLVCLDWAASPEAEALPVEAPVVLLFHGILGSSEDNYARNVMDLCLSRGWRPVVHDRWRIDYGEWRDVHTTVKHIHKRYPRAPIVAVAFSAGAHVLLSYLEMVGRDTPLVGAAAVSPALDLVKMISHMEASANPSYRYAMEYCIRGCVERHVANDRHLREAEVGDLLARFDSQSYGCHQMYDTFMSRLATYTGKPGSMRDEAAFMAKENMGLPFDGLEFRSQVMPLPSRSSGRSSAGHTAADVSADSASALSDDATYLSQGKDRPLFPSSAASGRDGERGASGDRNKEGEQLGRNSLRPDVPMLPRRSFSSSGDFARPNPDQLASSQPLPAEQYSPFGNGTAAHYRRTAGNNLHRVQIPCFILVSKDDQLMPPAFHRQLHRASQRKGSSIVYARTDRGGHCAWHEGMYPSGASFAERLVVQFFAALLAQQSHTHYILTVVRRMYRKQLAPRRPLSRETSASEKGDDGSHEMYRRDYDRDQHRDRLSGQASGEGLSSASEGETWRGPGARAAAVAAAAVAAAEQGVHRHGNSAVMAGKKLRRLPSEGAGTSVDLALADAHARRVRSRALLRREEGELEAASISRESRGRDHGQKPGNRQMMQVKGRGQQTSEEEREDADADAANRDGASSWEQLPREGLYRGGQGPGSNDGLGLSMEAQSESQSQSQVTVSVLAAPGDGERTPPVPRTLTADGDRVGQSREPRRGGGGSFGSLDLDLDGDRSRRQGRPVAASFADADDVMQSPSKFARVCSAGDLQEWHDDAEVQD